MKQFINALLLVAAAALCVTLAQAEEKERPGACRADVKKLCGGVQPGEGRIEACLKQHASELSPGCRERIAEVKEEVKEFHEACKSDVEAQCKGVQPGEGRIMRCLAEHKDKLSSGCREEISEAEKRHPCMKDMERLCKDIKPGDGRMGECMKKHKDELSAECKEHHKRHPGGDMGDKGDKGEKGDKK